jgi:hypothetical protein
MGDLVLIEWTVDDPVGAAACREIAGQSSPERLAHSARVRAERHARELEDGEGNRKRQLVLERTPGCSRKS